MAVASRAELRVTAVARSLLDFDTSYGLRPFLWLGLPMCIHRELLPRLKDRSDLSIVLLTYLMIRLLALSLSLWLGSAAGHRAHTLTTTPFPLPGDIYPPDSI